MVHGQTFSITTFQSPHWDGGSYPTSGDATSSSMGLSSVNLHQYTAITGHKTQFAILNNNYVIERLYNSTSITENYVGICS